MESSVLDRKFSFKKGNETITLPDPNPSWTPLKVKDHYSAQYAALLNANIDEPIITDTTINYSFSETPGTKG